MSEMVTIQTKFIVPQNALDAGVTPSLLMAYLRDAVLVMCKSKEPPNAYEDVESPGDPLFYLSSWPITHKFVKPTSGGFGSTGSRRGSAAT